MEANGRGSARKRATALGCPAPASPQPTCARASTESGMPADSAAPCAASRIERMAPTGSRQTFAGPPRPSPSVRPRPAPRPAPSRKRARHLLPPPSTPRKRSTPMKRSFIGLILYVKERYQCVSKHRPEAYMKRSTETISPRYRGLDVWKDDEILESMWEGQARAVAAVRRALPSIAWAAQSMAERLGQKGRIIYVGAGTSGRLAALDG